MSRMPTASRWLLATLLPIFIVTFSLHVFSILQTGAALPPFFASPARGDSHPHVGGLRPERDLRSNEVQVGDRLLEARGVDLEGVGYIGFYGWMVELADDRLEVPLTIEREGERLQTVVRLSSTGVPWSRFALWSFGVGLAVLVLLRRPASLLAQTLFAGLTSFAIFESPFTINYELTVLSQSIFIYGGGLAASLLMRFFFLFPDDTALTRRIPLSLSWLAALLFYTPRLSYLMGGPLPTALVPTVVLGADIGLATMTVAAVSWNYVHSGPEGRLRVRALLWGCMVAAAPVPVALILARLFPDLDLVRFGTDAVAFTGLFIPGALALAIIRHDAFDIDRLISATASLGASIAVLLGGLLAVAPGVASLVADSTGLDHGAAQLAFALAASLTLIPLTRILRPRVDRLLYPDRQAMELGFQELLAELGQRTNLDSLSTLAAARIQQILEPEETVLFSRGQHSFEPVFTSIGSSPVSRPVTSPTVTAVEAHGAPLARFDGALDPAGHAALDDLRAEIVVPFFFRGELDAFVTLSRATSGESYASTHLTLLAAAADKVESERTRHEDATRIRESGERVRTLEREREQAQAAALARSRSLATASHDLRQPIHAMGLLVEAVAARNLDAEARGLIASLGTATHSLEEMFDSLLDLSRLEAGQVQPEIRAVSLRALFERLRAVLEPAARAKGLELVCEPAPWAVRSDPIWLARILQNLIANAIRYTERGRVVLGAAPIKDGDEIEITVADTGPGIPADMQRAIFEEFRRLEGSERTDERGLGLGLAIVDRLIDLLGHELALDSAPGAGTTFRLRARRADDSVSAPSPASIAVPLDGLRVVVVDDQAAIRQGMASLLESWGCEVRAAGSAEDALEALEAWEPPRAPDLAVVDLRLAAGESGLDALSAIRKRWGEDLAALVITGESDAETLRAVRRAGHALLTKPVPPARLRAFLQGVAREGQRAARQG